MKTDDLLKVATPRPWRREDSEEASIVICIDGINICVMSSAENIEDEKRDADLILRAVNSFEAMRDALVGLLKNAPAPTKNVRKEFHYLVAIEAAKKALRLSEGESDPWFARHLAEGKAVQS